MDKEKLKEIFNNDFTHHQLSGLLAETLIEGNLSELQIEILVKDWKMFVEVGEF